MPMDRRGPKPQNNRQIINGMFYILRTGSLWRDVPERYGPYTSVYNRFNRYRESPRWQGADDRQLDCARASACLRCQKKSGVRCVGRSRGGLTTKIHARVDAQGRPVKLLISPGNDHDITAAEALLDGLEPRAIVLADKGYDADSVRSYIRAQGAIPNIPNRSNRNRKYRWKKALYRERNRVERFFNKLKNFRRIGTRYDKLGDNFFAFIQLASIRIFLRSIESTP
jgi:transposase